MLSAVPRIMGYYEPLYRFRLFSPPLKPIKLTLILITQLRESGTQRCARDRN
jgi:hypothetical protein